MKICFPVENNNGVESAVYGHFGSAPGFVMFDTETREHDFINNKDINHEHGKCNPVAALSGRDVDVVVVGGIGQGAIMGLMRNGITVMRSAEGDIESNIKLFENDGLQKLDVDMKTCSHGSHSCSH